MPWHATPVRPLVGGAVAARLTYRAGDGGRRYIDLAAMRSGAGGRLMAMIDLGPAARRVGALVCDVRDDQLAQPTPCPGMTVGDLVDHIGGLSAGFTATAQKRRVGGG